MRPQETGAARMLNDTKRRAPQFVLLSQHYELTPRGLAIERAISSQGVKNFPHFMEHVVHRRVHTNPPRVTCPRRGTR